MKNNAMDPRLERAFTDLQNVPERDITTAQRGRANFLKEAAIIRQAVSTKAEQRHSRWSNVFFPPVQRKERLTAMNTVIAVVLALVAIFGGGGATVYAAQDSLPDQVLYPVKTWSEDVTLSLTESTQTRLEHVLDFSDRRVTEMAGVLAAGESIPEKVETRFQNQLNLALELAAGMDDTQAMQQLEQILLRAESQLQIMSMLMSGAPESEEPLLLRVQTRLQEQIQMAAMGEADPQGFRVQIQQGFQHQTDTGNQPTGAGNGYQGIGGTGLISTPEPSGTSYGPGPGGNQSSGTPGQYGPGTQNPERTPQPGGGPSNRP